MLGATYSYPLGQLGDSSQEGGVVGEGVSAELLWHAKWLPLPGGGAHLWRTSKGSSSTGSVGGSACSAFATGDEPSAIGVSAAARSAAAASCCCSLLAVASKFWSRARALLPDRSLLAMLPDDRWRRVSAVRPIAPPLTPEPLQPATLLVEVAATACIQ